MAKNHRIALHFLIGYVVGYQTLNINGENNGGATSILCTIPDVGANLQETTLDSFKVTPPEGGLWGASSVWLMTFNTLGQIEGDYCYLDDMNASMMGVDPGWYTKESVDNWAPEAAGTVVVPFGAGVQILSDCGATVTFAGEVASEKAFSINDEVAGGCTTTGNASPIDLTLADLAITGPQGGLWGATSVWLMTFNNLGQVEGDYCYLDDMNASMMGVDVGWYTKESVDNWAPEAAGSVEIKAGAMFQILSDCGATITVPSPLN